MIDKLILKSCPICGGRLMVNSLMQYTVVTPINMRNGKAATSLVHKEDSGPMDASFISCENFEKCGFLTDCELHCSNHPELRISYEKGRYWKAV